MREEKISDLFKNVSWFQIIIIAALCGYFVYLANITSPVPNLQNRTVGNNTEWQIIYSVEDHVPPTYVAPSNMYLGIVGVLGLVLMFVLKERKIGRRLTEREAKEIIIKEFMKKKTMPLPNGKLEIEEYDITDITSVISRYETVREERKVFRYSFCILMTHKRTKLPKYVKIYFHPYEGLIDGIVETDKDMRDYDMCSKCGKDYGVKYISPEEVYKMKELFQGLGRRP